VRKLLCLLAFSICTYALFSPEFSKAEFLIALAVCGAVLLLHDFATFDSEQSCITVQAADAMSAVHAALLLHQRSWEDVKWVYVQTDDSVTWLVHLEFVER
jgi:hypothetical protein